MVYCSLFLLDAEVVCYRQPYPSFLCQVKSLCDDLRVLAKQDFKYLLKYKTEAFLAPFCLGVLKVLD